MAINTWINYIFNGKFLVWELSAYNLCVWEDVFSLLFDSSSTTDEMRSATITLPGSILLCFFIPLFLFIPSLFLAFSSFFLVDFFLLAGTLLSFSLPLHHHHIYYSLLPSAFLIVYFPNFLPLYVYI